MMPCAAYAATNGVKVRAVIQNVNSVMKDRQVLPQL